MSVPLIINGVTFQYPQQGDTNWGPTLTNWSTAVTNGMLQKAGGTFTLTADADFGASFGLKSLYYKSRESNIATAGILRLSNASVGIGWRNAANNGNLLLTTDASNNLLFNGVIVGSSNTLTDSHIFVGNASNVPADVAMSGDITITNTGVTAIGAGKIVNAQINASAAIALSKLASTTAYFWYAANTSGVLTPLGVTASRAVVTDANGLPSASTVTAATLAFLDATSSVQTQINGKLSLSGGTMTGNIAMGGNSLTGTGSVSFNNTATGGITGTTTNDSAAAGKVGEYVESVITSLTNVATAGNLSDLTSIALTAGDWDVSASIYFIANGATGIASVRLAVSNTAGNSGTGLVVGNNYLFTSMGSNNETVITLPSYRMSLAGSATAYLKMNVTAYTGGPPQGEGRISARRVR